MLGWWKKVIPIKFKDFLVFVPSESSYMSRECFLKPQWFLSRYMKSNDRWKLPRFLIRGTLIIDPRSRIQVNILPSQILNSDRISTAVYFLARYDSIVIKMKLTNFLINSSKEFINIVSIYLPIFPVRLSCLFLYQLRYHHYKSSKLSHLYFGKNLPVFVFLWSIRKVPAYIPVTGFGDQIYKKNLPGRIVIF